VLGPLGEVDGHRSAVGKTVLLRPFVAAGSNPSRRYR
jgi:hypothetical protein